MLHSQQGFTLIELIAAFVIFALGFGVLMQILGGALHTTRQSAEQTQAALYAQSLLDAQGIGQALHEGSSNGDFDATYHWQLNIARYQPEDAQGAAPPLAVVMPGQPELFQLELIVSWGNRYLQHHARFVTLRSSVPRQPAGGTVPPLSLPPPGSNLLPSGMPPGFG